MNEKRERNRLLIVAEWALELAGMELPRYSCPKSPKVFTQPQLLACLVLRAYEKKTYRGIVELLDACEALQQVLGLKRLPDFSTLQRFSERVVSPDLVDRLLGRLIERFGAAVAGEDAAMDSTGMEPTAASAYYKARTGNARKGYVKLSLVIICGCMLPLGLVVSRGPQNDKSEAPELLDRARSRGQPKRLFADKGYDAEWVHEFCWQRWKVRSYIPPVRHRRDGTIGGRYRSRMGKLPKAYGKRWHAESFMSGLKRTTGSQIMAVKESTMNAEAALRVLAYAIRR